MKDKYPRVKSLGLEIVDKPVPHIKSMDVEYAAIAFGIREPLMKILHGETQYMMGPYPWDVEAALELIQEQQKQP